MISFLRRHIGSRLGGMFALLFLLVIGVAFVAGDIERKGSSSFLSMFSGDQVAKVGGASLAGSELQSRVQRAFEQQRREQPGLKFTELLAQDGVNVIADQLIAALAIDEFAASQGVHVGKRLVDARIAEIPAFGDAAGKFSQTVFQQMLRSQGVSEEALRRDIEQGEAARLVISPAGLGTRLSGDIILPYAALLLEAREGRIAPIPAALFAPKADPTEAELKKFFADHAARYTIPEQRRLRYAVIDPARFAPAANPTEAEIAAAYERDKAKYAARETRSIEQLILPTEAAAKAALGKPLATTAREAGLEVSTFKEQSRADFAAKTSDAVAQAAFTAAQGDMAGPVRATLGWALVQVTQVNRIPARSLADAREEIAKALAMRKRTELTGDFTAKLEDQGANGSTFDEIVKENGLTAAETPALVGTGQNANDTGYKAPAEVLPLLKPGFEMEAEDEPQLVSLGGDGRYALLAVGAVTAPAPPPLDKIRPLVVQHYKLEQGAARAAQVAEAIRAQVAKGVALDKALAGAGVPLPPLQKMGLRRADLMRTDKQVPPELSLLFDMPKGGVRIAPISGDRGYFVIQLDNVTQSDPARVPGLVEKVRSDLGGVVGEEYREQLARAIQIQVGVRRNPAAIAKVTGELARVNGATGQ